MMTCLQFLKSSFTAKIDIIDDTNVEGSEFLTLSLAGHEATASITDNDVVIEQPAQLISITGNTVTEGKNKPIIFKYDLDKKTPYKQTFQSIFSTTSEELLAGNKLAITGLDTESVIGFTANNGVKMGLDRTITVPAGVQSFSIFIDVIDDNLPEFTENLVSSVGATEALSTIIDNDNVQPLLIATSKGATEGMDDFMRVNFRFNYERQGDLILS